MFKLNLGAKGLKLNSSDILLQLQYNQPPESQQILPWVPAKQTDGQSVWQKLWKSQQPQPTDWTMGEIIFYLANIKINQN